MSTSVNKKASGAFNLFIDKRLSIPPLATRRRADACMAVQAIVQWQLYLFHQVPFRGHGGSCNPKSP